MNNLATLKGMACLGVLLGSPGVVADYATDLDQAAWRAERTASRCVLEHAIEQVATARFSANGKAPPVLEVNWHARGIQGGQTTLSVVSAPWQPATEQPLAQSHWQRQQLRFDQHIPEALHALADGRWLAISAPGNPHRLVISGIHFQQAHNDFRLCRGEGGVDRAFNGERLTLHFQSGTRALSPEQRRQLAALAAHIGERKPASLLLESHTDNRGDEALNLEISRQRAERVADELRRFHPALPMAIRAFGEAYPATDNSTPAGRYQNRRVVISLIKAEQAS
ncbi:putative outer membrane protein [Oceanimonas sp. GK1]|uniref:MotY family protein n=1 Tax=Oceanimonas sp. (strain GK1 / IBRC-M 10197) TaxID=511062 RepID=UPI000249569B|nr:OmpA family protein [Oceanimonas sp. GK1]AEY02570.1 putative outer membrane protein [Oceanimonas sp. GK1]